MRRTIERCASKSNDRMIGVRERYRFQQHGVDDGEDRRVRACAERQCGDGRDREARTPPEQPQRVRDVFESESSGSTVPTCRSSECIPM